MGGVAGLGYTFRLIAQQASKFLNGIWPGSGSAVSSAIAAAGTSAIGKGAPLPNYKLVILRHSLFLYPSGHRTRKARKHVVFLTVTDRLNRKKVG